MTLRGRISIFGGPYDKGMAPTEGLALWEHHEANRRPDLFMPRPQEPDLGTSQRLRWLTACYFAYRFDKSTPRALLQRQPWMFTNPLNGLRAYGSLVDFGPGEWTGRTFDISPKLAVLLRVKTDSILEGCPMPSI